MNLEEHITAHFTWREVLFSETAARLGIDNTPPPEIVPNIQRMAQFMERLRLALNARPIFISSWYRSPEVNHAIGGSKTSAHMKGLACDFLCPMMGTPLATATYISLATTVDFDQLVHEFGRWVHVGLGDGNRRQLLTAKLVDGKTVYVPGLEEV